MESIKRLQVVEAISVNPERLETLYEESGFSAAEHIVCRALEDLAFALTQAERFLQTGNMSGLDQTAERLIETANRVGMTSLSSVGQHVRVTLAQGDQAGLAACVARMSRIGEGSLMAIWDLQDVNP